MDDDRHVCTTTRYGWYDRVVPVCTWCKRQIGARTYYHLCLVQVAPNSASCAECDIITGIFNEILRQIFSTNPYYIFDLVQMYDKENYCMVLKVENHEKMVLNFRTMN